MDTKQSNSIKLDRSKLFGRHWIGEIQIEQAAVMPSVKTQNAGPKPAQMPATKIGQPKDFALPATKISAVKTKTYLPATKIGQGKD